MTENNGLSTAAEKVMRAVRVNQNTEAVGPTAKQWPETHYKAP